MANHVSSNESGDVAFEYFGDSYSLTMKRGVQEGSEVFISYGARSNDQLLQYYGFVETDNPHDVYIMPALREWDIDALEKACGFSFESDRLLKIDRAGLLGNDNISSSEDSGNENGDVDDVKTRGGIIVSRAGGLDPAVMQALRAMVSDEKEWTEAGEAVGNFAAEVSQKNEKLARLAAVTELRAELAKKATSIEEDEKLLKQLQCSKSLVTSDEELLAIKFRIEKKKLLQEEIIKLQQ